MGSDLYMNPPPPEPCKWEKDSAGNWVTECGRVHEWLEGGPTQNLYICCPYCGAELEEVSAEQCEHEWVDARNKVVVSGEICLKCNTLRAGNLGD